MQCISQQDQAAAVGLPAEFLALEGSPAERASLLVARHWAGYPERGRRQLGQVLVLILTPLDVAGPSAATEAVRERCVDAVTVWLDRQQPNE